MMTSNARLSLRSRSSARRARLLACAAVAAVALAGQSSRADAQAFQGTIGGTSGSVTRTPTSGTAETITIGSPTAIIDWNPSCSPSCAGTFDFLPTANVATFEGASNFAVLNRIGGGATIQLNGSVISQLQGSPGTRTGTILFQAPNGLIVGPTAVFDVGSLVLTSLEIATVGEGGSGPYFNPNALSFSLGSSSPSALVYVQPGGQINATAEGSFVALVAPRVDQAGTVNVNGSAAYVGAEQVDLTVNAGLFDIAVTSGTTDGNGVVHTGTTGGPASTGGADGHGIYLVAVPKAQFLEVLLSGSAGFAPPVSPTIENGVLVLSAGYDVAGGQLAGPVAGAAPARFNLLGGTHTSDIRGAATENFIVNSASSTLAVDGDVVVRADNDIVFNALNNFDIDISGDLVLDASDDRSNLSDGSDAQGRLVTFTVQPGSNVTIGGDAVLNANAFGASGFSSLPGGDGNGGSALVFVDNGTLTVGGTLVVLASGTGGDGAISGNGSGGSASVETVAGGDIVAGSGVVQAEGAGGGGPGSDGGDGSGGSVFITATGTGSTITFQNDSTFLPDISASGYGGDNNDGGTAGDGEGGDITVSAQAGGSIALSNTPALVGLVWARGFGGLPVADGATGGEGAGGSIVFEAVGAGSSLSGGGLNISANGFGIQGNATQGANVTGGDAIGGTTTVRANDGGVVTLNNSVVRASGIGGFGTGTGNGGNGIGGLLTVEIDGGGLVLGGTSIVGGVSFGASGGGGDGAIGGDGLLGNVLFRVVNGGTLTATDALATPDDLNLIVFTQAAGGIGTVQGGSAAAGNIVFEIDPDSTGSTIDINAATFESNGIGGSVVPGLAGTGGTGTGGSAIVVAGSANDDWTFGRLVVTADASGGRVEDNSAGSTGGDAFGGVAQVGVEGGASITVTESTTVSAIGGGGDASDLLLGTPAGTGGDGTGGTAVVSNAGGTLTLGSTAISAGGGGGSSGDGGIGQGGFATLSSTAGQTILTDLGVESEANGGGGDTGAEGDAIGGFSFISISGGSVQVTGDAELDADAEAEGGGTAGGNATGGQASVDVSGGSLDVGGELLLEVNAEGGSGVTPGIGIGGLASVSASGGGTVTLGSLVAGAQGGEDDGEGTVEGIGGTVRIEANSGSSIAVAGATLLSADAFGGQGEGSGDGASATGGLVQVLAIGGELQLATLTASAEGIGGSAANGNGGDGFGGTISVFTTDGGEIGFTDATLSAGGTGGSGLVGGTGTGGINSNPPELTPTAGAFVVARDATITGTNLSISNNGVGGAGTSGAGGAALGGQSYVESWNGNGPTLVDIDNVTLSATATGGQGGTGQAGGAAIGGEIGAYAETLTGNLQIGTLVANTNAVGGAGGAGGRGGDAQGGFSGNIGTVSGPGSGTVTGGSVFGTITATANGTGGAGGAGGAGGDGFGGAASLLARGGTLNVTSASFTANGTGGAGNNAAGGIGAGGDIGALLTVRFQTADAATVSVGSFTGTSIGTGGAGAQAGASQWGTAAFELIGSSATIGNLSLLVAGSQQGSLPGSVIGVDNSALTVTQAFNIDVAGSLDFAAVGSGLITAATLDSSSGEPTTITHSGRAPGAGTIVGNNLGFASGDEIVVEAGSVVAASAVVGFDSGEDLEIRGEIYAPVINLRSVDIEIDAGGVVGDEDDPGEVNLVVVPSGEQAEIGDGLPGGDGYKLTQDEIERIEASRATVTVSRASNDPARAPDVLLGDLIIEGTLEGAASSVSVVTDGTLRVVGDVEYFGAAEGDTLLIRADERLEVITPEGSITMLADEDVLGGRLLLASNNIVVADAELAAQLAADPDFDGRNEALLANDGEVLEVGFVRARGIGLYSGGTAFVRNTGDDTNFAGLLFGDGGLVISSLARLPDGGSNANPTLDVVVFGARLNPDNSFTGGQELFTDVDFDVDEEVTYTAASEFNTCAISTGCFAAPPPNTTNATVLIATLEDPAAELIESGDEEASLTFGTNFVGIVDTGSLTAEQLIDQAVLSGGDSTAWDGTCSPDEPECQVEDGGPGE